VPRQSDENTVKEFGRWMPAGMTCPQGMPAFQKCLAKNSCKQAAKAVAANARTHFFEGGRR
jgi:hypothetical protein